MQDTKKIIVQPAAEPITLEEAKAHLRVTFSDDDTMISTMINVARILVERWTGRVLISQTWEYYLNHFPALDFIELPLPPLVSVTSIKYTDQEGTETTIDSGTYTVDNIAYIGSVNLNIGESWPSAALARTNPIKITYVAGYADAAAVPGHFKQAILYMVSQQYENREPILIGTIQSEMPLALGALLAIDDARGI